MAAAAIPEFRSTCERCRKAVATCYCMALKPFESPIEFVILQHFAEFHNPIATGRMANLAMTNSRLFVGREFGGDARIDALIAGKSRRNLLLYPGRDAQPLEDVIDELSEPGAKPPVFWILDAKWSQASKFLRLSPNVKQIPMVKFAPPRASTFQIRKQPKPAYVSTIETAFLVIDKYIQQQGLDFQAHHALLEVFQYLVQQQLGFVNLEKDTRHAVAKKKRAARRAVHEAQVEAHRRRKLREKAPG